MVTTEEDKQAKLRHDMGLSKAHGVNRTAKPNPAIGGSSGYDAWYREQQVTRFDKKNKRIESREIRDSDSGSSLEAYIEGIFVSSMEQMGIFGVHERSLIEQIA